MRELRQDIEYSLELETPKEELDQIDEMKIEDVLMGLKGLKQEEVFSFLGKNNFTPAETEEWLKMMTSAGLGNYEQLAAVDTTDMEQLQLSFNAHFEGIQNNHGHSVTTNSYMSKFTSIERMRPKIESESVYNETLSSQSGGASQYVWPSIKRSKDEEVQPQQRFPSMWPRYPGPPDYPLLDYQSENLREEEIVATNIAEELISTTIEDEVELKAAQPNNTYVIQSSVDGIDVIPDKPKPIKLLIKRVESEDETSDSPALRVKSKRTRQPSAKRRQEVMSSPLKQKRVKRPSISKCKNKTQHHPTNAKRKDVTFDEIDFPLVNSVHQDDDFVYPSLDMSDDEDDIYSFSQGDDETWTPKIKMKINDTKNDRPARDRKRNNAVAKYLEAAAIKRADSSAASKSKTKSSTNTEKWKHSGNSLIADEKKCSLGEFSSSKINHSTTSYTLPSTSNDDPCYSLSCTESPSSSQIAEVNSSDARKSTIKSKNKSGTKCARRIIPPKTCKLVQESPGAKSTTLTVQMNSAKKLMKSTMSISNTTGCNTPVNDKKSPSAAYITKRGKPKKGMATAKQRLGKILKMHKMFF